MNLPVDLAALRSLSASIAPVVPAGERVLPVGRALQPLLPDGALVRGSSVQLLGVGASSLALALLAEPSAAGCWTAVVGLPELGLLAADEHGLALERLLLIDPPPDRRAVEVVAALVDGIELVVLDTRLPIGASDARRLAARARERGAVVLLVQPGVPGEGSGALRWSPDVALTVREQRWQGLGRGQGVLRRRRVLVEAEGRGRWSRQRRAALLLPTSEGSVTAAPDAPDEGRVLVPFGSVDRAVS